MHQDINTIIADFVNAAVERKIKEYMSDYANDVSYNINQINARLDQLEEQKRAAHTPESLNTRMAMLDHVMQIEHQLRTENQEQGSTPMGKILQLTLRVEALEEQVHKLKANNIYTPDHVMARLSYVEGAINNMHNTASINQMIEDQINESQQKVEDMLEEKFEEFDVEHKIEKLLEEAIDDGTISITFTR